jgi:hypothetical protein
MSYSGCEILLLLKVACVLLLQAYNSPETEYYNCAVQLEKFFYNKLRDHCLIEKAKD